MRADRTSCSFTKYDSSIFSISAPRTLREQIGKPCEVCGCDSISTWKFGKQSVDGCHMKRRNEFFQFREKNTHKP